MNPYWQPTDLRDNRVVLEPLQEAHYDELYAVASDPLVWAQHPNPDRYRPEVFRKFFEGAMASGGAFLIRAADDGRALGSSRFYDPDEVAGEVMIGYTFLARSCWGRGFNPAVKRLMLVHAFGRVGRVVFHVGAGNIRSQRAMERLGARKVGEVDVAYHGEAVKRNFVYEMRAGDLAEMPPGGPPDDAEMR
jgi:RimJ/RimL family protein N-acetyltransferase